jgi:regulator of protease activity HflC (stomatin/prohibitin superfamily)
MMMIGMTAVIMIFLIPIIAIVTEHSKQKAKLKLDTVKEELKLEQLKNQNYLLETEKMRLELEKMRLEDTQQDPFIIK